MKKTFALLLALCMCTFLLACGKSQDPFDLSKDSFNSIHSAYEKIEIMSADIYEAWRIGIQEGTKSLRNKTDLSFLTDSLSLTDEDLHRGLASVNCNYREWVEFVDVCNNSWGSARYDVDNLDDYTRYLQDCTKYDHISENGYSYESDPVYDYVSRFGDDFSGYIHLVIIAYEAKGTSDEISTLLNSAKDQMKTLSDKHSDYEHYPNLKDYYTTTQAFFDYCQNPTGSFEQAVTTIEDYKNEARGYYYDLEYAFGE